MVEEHSTSINLVYIIYLQATVKILIDMLHMFLDWLMIRTFEN